MERQAPHGTRAVELLKPYRIKTMAVKVSGETVRGYKLTQFTNAIRQVGVLDVTAVTAVTSCRSQAPGNGGNAGNPRTRLGRTHKVRHLRARVRTATRRTCSTCSGRARSAKPSGRRRSCSHESEGHGVSWHNPAQRSNARADPGAPEEQRVARVREIWPTRSPATSTWRRSWLSASCSWPRCAGRRARTGGSNRNLNRHPPADGSHRHRAADVSERLLTAPSWVNSSA